MEASNNAHVPGGVLLKTQATLFVKLFHMKPFLGNIAHIISIVS